MRYKFFYDAPDWYLEEIGLPRRELRDLVAVRLVRVNFVVERLINAQFTWDVAPFLWIEIKLRTKDYNCSFPYNNKYSTNEVELLWPLRSLRLAKEIMEIQMAVELQDHWSKDMRETLKAKIRDLFIRYPYLYLSIYQSEY